MLFPIFAGFTGIAVPVTITEVGTAVTFTAAIGASSEDKTLPTGLQEDDLVIVATASDNSITISEDGTWTRLDTNVASAPGGYIIYKFMGAVPDTNVTIDQSNTTVTCGIIRAFRGVDLSTPFDNGINENSGATGSGNGPAHTTITPGCLRNLLTMIDDDDAGVITEPAGGWTDTVYVDTGQTSLSVGASIGWSLLDAENTGAVDPGAWSSVSGNDGWRGAHFALRPAA
jgi:hypothetical protein